MHDPDETGAFLPGDGDEPAGDRATPARPQRIGRYRIEKVLGKGGFGIVYRGRDEQLLRPVAIKVPHTHLAVPGRIEAYLAEARAVAQLDHPHIVPVWDIGSTDEFPFFVVSKYIEGTDLAQRLNEARLSFHAAAELIAAIAEGLHHAHKRGLVHRDIKPGNILLDQDHKAYLADFGLALREQDLGLGPRRAGTPAYMSPEQARGEGHRVDGRSDVFSLGVVLYQLLTGTRPFKSHDENELLRQISAAEVRPPRQIEDRIHKELERICLKALSKRAADRFTTAKDLADDLHNFLQQRSPAESHVLRSSAPEAASVASTPVSPAPGPAYSPTASHPPLRIIPKGLRAFDVLDADSFLELLAGPRDREGLPDSIRFWKSRIEDTDPETTFRVGLVYGPSGCGKSSLFKAGLLPRLSPEVRTIYVEATADETESRLLNGLRKRCPNLPAHLSLAKTLAAVRRDPSAMPGKKVLIVMDQFEQWLHAHKDEKEETELVQALRHCDGERLLCVVMVRDDFWLAVSRFMRELEIDLVPGRNIALVDLFDCDHARRVLAAFGRAFGKLPELPQDLSREQNIFLNEAIAGLAQENKVICVRLALFAEMMKSRSWIPATLKEVGGTEGLGVAFLEETFSAGMANPKHRFHQKAARAVLKALLPDTGRDIKGNLRSRAELLAASGYATRPRDFDELLGILDGETRLISPTDPEGGESERPTDVETGQKYYQLSHDYLVHSLRDWLTRKQKETRRGQAELRLEDRAALWNEKPERRHLPSPVEWVQIRAFTRRRDWTGPQRKMMRRADAHYLLCCLALLTVCGLIGFGAREYDARREAVALRNHLLSAEIAQIPKILDAIEPQRAHVEPLLFAALVSETDSRRKLRLNLGLVRSHPEHVSVLYDRMLEAPPEEFVVIRHVLAPFKDDLTARLWPELENTERGSDRRFRAGCALVDYAQQDQRWNSAAQFVIDGLIAESPLMMDYWKAALQPVRLQLLPALALSLESRPVAEQRALIDFYRYFAGDNPDAYQPLYERLNAERPEVIDVEKAKRKATIAAALVALGKGEDVWPLLIHTTTPTVRSFLIERLGTAGVEPKQLKERLDREKDVTARRALILALGNFPPERAPELVPVLAALYEQDPDSGIHSAAGWVLGKWGRQEIVAGMNRKLAGKPWGQRNWYVSVSGQTFAILDVTPPSRGQASTRLAIATTEVTVAQFRSLWKDPHFGDEDASDLKFNREVKFAKDERCPVSWVSWYDAAAYCNWLSDREGLRECYCLRKSWLGPYFEYQDRGGYRLPTDEEWLLACRAGAETRCGFGIPDEELANAYAWWNDNARREGTHLSFPVGLLKPNEFGLFDLHGNVAEWCQGSFAKAFLAGNQRSSIRGGNFRFDFRKLSSDTGSPYVRNWQEDSTGFRPVRPIP